MKKSLFYWVSRDKTAAASGVWIDIPETEADVKELNARKERLLSNPIAMEVLQELKTLGFRWIHGASANQFDGFDGTEDAEDYFKPDMSE